MSFDVFFYGLDYVYGIFEWVISFVFKFIKGFSINNYEFYCFFNFDVFEYLDELFFGLYGFIFVMVFYSKKGIIGFFLLNVVEM